MSETTTYTAPPPSPWGDELRKAAEHEAEWMCCNGTGECGLVDCVRDEARLVALRYAAGLVDGMTRRGTW